MDFTMPGLELVETSRLVVRRLLPTDAPAYHGLMSDLRSDDRVKEFLGLGELLTVDQYAAAIKAPKNRCFFAVVRKESSAFIGIAGFLPRQCFLAPELYVWLAPDSWGQRLGPEAANALVNAAFRGQHCEVVIGIPHWKNARSIKSLPKMNMKRCASVVDLVEVDPGVYVKGREHQFPIFSRHRNP